MRQVLALIWLRFRLTVNRARAGGALRLLGGLLVFLVMSAVSLAMAVGFGLLTAGMAETGNVAGLRTALGIAFYLLTFIAVVFPVILGTADQRFDASRFLCYPVGRGNLYAVSVGACFADPTHLFYYPTLAAVAAAALIRAPIPLVPGLALILLFLINLVAWYSTILILAQALLSSRRLKEIAGFLAILIVTAASVGVWFWQASTLAKEEPFAFLAPLKPYLIPALGILPPSLAASGLARLSAGDGTGALLGIAGLAGWALTGLLAGYAVFLRYQLGERGSRVRPKGRAGAVSSPGPRDSRAGRLVELAIGLLPPPVRPSDQTLAQAGKELRYLSRSAQGRFHPVSTLMLGAMFAFMLRGRTEGQLLGMDAEMAAFPGTVLYFAFLANYFMSNFFGWDGKGAQTYYFSPVAMRTILLGKNLALWTWNLANLTLLLVIWGLVVGLPRPAVLVAGMFSFVAANLLFAAQGNVSSILFPVGRDISSLMGSTPSQTAILISMLSLLGVAVLSGLTLALPGLLGLSGLEPVFLAGLALLAAGGWFLSLDLAMVLLESRRERFLNIVTSSD